jgi:hypothetical protein
MEMRRLRGAVSGSWDRRLEPTFKLWRQPLSRDLPTHLRPIGGTFLSNRHDEKQCRVRLLESAASIFESDRPGSVADVTRVRFEIVGQSIVPSIQEAEYRNQGEGASFRSAGGT